MSPEERNKLINTLYSEFLKSTQHYLVPNNVSDGDLHHHIQAERRVWVTNAITFTVNKMIDGDNPTKKKEDMEQT